MVRCDNVDRFIAEKVQPQHRELVEAFRALVERVAPELAEGMRGGTEKYYGVPVYRLNRDVIVLSPSKKALTISFAKGARFDDPQGQLGGAGKTSRTLVLAKPEEFDAELIAGFIRQAVEQDR